MGYATIYENIHGTAAAHADIYGAQWFSALWALLAAAGVFYIIKRKVRRVSVIALHASFVVILLGALITHVSGKQGVLHVVEGRSVNMYQTSEGLVLHLPFSVRMTHCGVDYHDGTEAASDYHTWFAVIDNDGKTQNASVSMNNIFCHKGVRLYQSGYDPDMKGAYLAVNDDPWGVPVTYCGYGLLFVSLLWLLFDPKGQYRKLLKKTALLLLLLGFGSMDLSAANTVSVDRAEEFGRLCIVYNDRVCPLQTFAMDFTKKLYGKSSYNGMTAEQVLLGFIFWPDEWKQEKIIKVKSGEVREKYSLDKYCAFSDFFSDGGYILGPDVQEYFQGTDKGYYKEVGNTDDKLMLILDVMEGKPLRIFPYRNRWYSPADKLPSGMEPDRQLYFRNAITVLKGFAQDGNRKDFDAMLSRMQKYQRRYGATAIPSESRLMAERLYNAVPFATILFMLCLTMGMVSIVRHRIVRLLSLASLTVAFVALTFCLALRWMISGTIPMTNGYETMLLMAWIIMLASAIAQRRFPVLLTFGLLLSGFCLLVSHISQMDPNITHTMPVLSSPLLSLHVSVIMMSYALLGLTAISSAYGLVIRKKQDEMCHLALLLLYPAIVCLGFGIFIGAIWANVSWGSYWSWDAKETWALITFMIYAVPLHRGSIPAMNRPRVFLAFVLLSFLVVLMTYFGVNYCLSGMHSYA